MAFGNERREHKRLPCKTPILHNTNPPDFLYKGTMFNYSKKGLYFESDEDLLEGHEISISINIPLPQFPNNPHQHFHAKIVWCQKLSGSPYKVGYGAKLI
jgi:hypothetical protein